jgi:hypothetical protein
MVVLNRTSADADATYYVSGTIVEGNAPGKGYEASIRVFNIKEWTTWL